jgi:hypothetical protein
LAGGNEEEMSAQQDITNNTIHVGRRGGFRAGAGEPLQTCSASSASNATSPGSPSVPAPCPQQQMQQSVKIHLLARLNSVSEFFLYIKRAVKVCAKKMKRHLF